MKTQEKRIILYVCYTISNWKYVTEEILRHANSDTILVHYTLPSPSLKRLNETPSLLALPNHIKWFKKKFSNQFTNIVFSFSINRKTEGESVGARKQFRWLHKNKDNFLTFTHLTYCHSKGVGKEENPNITKWREHISYYLFQRKDLESYARQNNYKTYGSLRLKNNQQSAPDPSLSPYRAYIRKCFSGCNWHYPGTFYTIFLDGVHRKILNYKIEKRNRWSMEAFPGRVFSHEEAYNCASIKGDNYSSFKAQKRDENDLSSQP